MKIAILTDEKPGARYQAIFGDVSRIVDAAKRSAARSVNAVVNAAKWMIGRCIVEFEQSGERRTEYGTALLERLAADLTQRFGRGFSCQNIQQMRLYYLTYPSDQIQQTLSGESHRIPQQAICQTASGKYAVLPLTFDEIVD